MGDENFENIDEFENHMISFFQAVVDNINEGFENNIDCSNVNGATLLFDGLSKKGIEVIKFVGKTEGYNLIKDIEIKDMIDAYSDPC